MKKTVNDIKGILPAPIVIEVSNTGLVNRNNIRLFNGYAFTPANITPFPNVRVVSGFSTVSYTQQARSIAQNPIKIGMIGFASLSNSPAKFTPTMQNQLSIWHQDIQGNRKASTMIVRDDPTARKTVATAPANFTLDNETTIILKTIHASETVQILIYPAIPEMKGISYPDVDRGIITVSKSLSFEGENPMQEGNKNYMYYRIGGLLLVAGFCGLIYWMGKEIND